METTNKDRLLIFDLMSLVYRCHFYISGYSDKNRTKTAEEVARDASLLFNEVKRRFASIIKEQSPTHVLVASDGQGLGFRNAIYAEYKANRSGRPAEIVAATKEIEKFLNELKIIYIEIPGVEADDIIGSACVLTKSLDIETFIISSDKDLCQLIGGSVRLARMVDGGKFDLYDKAAVEAKFGVGLEQLTDYMALVGDASDNIPGVTGIGPKTAAALLRDFSTLENLLEKTSEIKSESTRKRVETGVEDARLSKKLVSINSSINLGFEIEEFELNEETVGYFAK